MITDVTGLESKLRDCLSAGILYDSQPGLVFNIMCVCLAAVLQPRKKMWSYWDSHIYSTFKITGTIFEKRQLMNDLPLLLLPFIEVKLNYAPD